MRILGRTVAVVALLGLVVGGWYGCRLVWGKPLSIHHFADRISLERLQHQPELLTFLGIVENTSLDFHSYRLSDLSPASMAARVEDARVNHEILQTYRKDDLDTQEQLTFEFLAWSLGSTVTSNEFPYHFDTLLYVGPYPANQISGAQTREMV